MKKYLANVVEWAAHRILARAVQRTVVILDELDESFEHGTPKTLPAPKLPEIEYIR